LVGILYSILLVYISFWADHFANKIRICSSQFSLWFLEGPQRRITRLVMTELISTNFPPTDNSFPFQLLSFFSILLFYHFPITVTKFFIVHRNPQVPKWEWSVGQPKMWQYCSCTSLASPKQKISLLWKIILRHESFSRAHKSSLRFFAFSRSCTSRCH
jgi:hypothetical protein